MKNLILVALGLGLVGCVTVQPGEVGVVTDWGRVQPWVYPEGFHWISWIGVEVIPMTTRTMSYEMGSSGTPAAGSEAAFEANVERGDAVVVRSEDQLEISIEATVQFHLSPGAAPDVYRFYGARYADTVVHPNVRTAIRDTAANFAAVDLVDHREEFQNQLEELVLTQLREVLEARGAPADAIVLEAILVQNIDLPDSLDASIAAVVVERQNTLQRTQALLTARAEADRLRAEAEGAAAATTIRASAEAEANAIREASLTPAVLRSREIELMASLLENESSRIVMLPAGATPLFDLRTE